MDDVPKKHEMSASWSTVPSHDERDPIHTDTEGMQFPLVLHNILNVSDLRNETIISWAPDGLSFKVHNRVQVLKRILPNYFRITKYESFARQLQLWGFKFCKQKGPRQGHCKYFLLFLMRMRMRTVLAYTVS